MWGNNLNNFLIYSSWTTFLSISALHMRHHVTEKECSKSLRNSTLALPSICREFSTLNPVRLETLLPWIATRGHQWIDGCSIFRKKFQTSVRIISQFHTQFYLKLNQITARYYISDTTNLRIITISVLVSVAGDIL